jgi:hypothetical protein
MARYVVEVEGNQRGPAAPETVDGLAVAKARAQKISLSSAHAVIVRDSETGKVVARFEPQRKAEESSPTLASSVKRMRAANDRLKEALVPARSARKKRG